MGADTGTSFARGLAERHGLPFVDLVKEPPDRIAATKLSAALLERTNALPYCLSDDTLFVAVSDPSDVTAIDELRLASVRPLKFAVADHATLERVRQLVLSSPDPAHPEQSVNGNGNGSAQAPAAQVLAEILTRAQALGASDVHMIPGAETLIVRARIDGVLHELASIPREEAVAVIARLKALAGLDIAERRRPQGGRLTDEDGTGVDARIALLPTVDGEGAVLRLMERENQAPSLTSLGLTNEMQMQLEQIISSPTGGLFVTGPTGSGKSTSLYAALADIVHPEINAITIEDPVERRLPGIFQIQVDEKIGVNYESVLRAVLRADPDVIMVGEIRDPETARLTMGMSIAGHLVLTTLHAEDAPSSITRLLDMGVEPYLVAAGATAVLAQRLARKLCEACRTAYHPSPVELSALGYDDEQAQAGELQFYRPIGCPECHGGYRGRLGIFQLLVMTPELQRLVLAGAPIEAIATAASSAGMRTHREDGLAKAERGLTSIDELWRVLT